MLQASTLAEAVNVDLSLSLEVVASIPFEGVETEVADIVKLLNPEESPRLALLLRLWCHESDSDTWIMLTFVRSVDLHLNELLNALVESLELRRGFLGTCNYSRGLVSQKRNGHSDAAKGAADV
ncbi:MAG: uncharacterized protein KVP18_004670 [Porospora cf. gigantea A]|uniref:uncharacterized protein n=1 Tax=Porospora cf. gigantea A TaxID=2853593 RepID=UPI00355A26D2|nr:MAG: hypothetical protein KVP18_004670 [Porospora cf. gigantea A]